MARSDKTVKLCSKDGKKEYLGDRCGFCGTQLYDNPPVVLMFGKTSLELRAGSNAVDNLKKARDTGLWYWLKICPACGSFVGVQVIETKW